MKATIEFDLNNPDEARLYKLAMSAKPAYSVLWDMRIHLLESMKTQPKHHDFCAETILARLDALLKKHDVHMEDLFAV